VPHRAVLSQALFAACLSNDAEAINGIPAAVSRWISPWAPGPRPYSTGLVEAGERVVGPTTFPFDRQWDSPRAPCRALGKTLVCPSMEDLCGWPASAKLRATPSVRDLARATGRRAATRALTDCIYHGSQVFEALDRRLEGPARRWP